MQYFGTAKTEFDASHQIFESPRCSRLHGHRYLVEAECIGRLDPKTSSALDLSQFATDLSMIAEELRFRHLPDMMPGVTTTPFGIASWFMERLLASWPVIRVSVSETPNTTATVTREVRAYGAS